MVEFGRHDKLKLCWLCLEGSNPSSDTYAKLIRGVKSNINN